VILLDTTVLVYAVGTDHPLREPCRRLLQAHADGSVQATTTVEVIQEFTHVRARRQTRADAVSIARRYTTAFSLLTTRAADLDLGLTLFERYPNLGAFDAILAAVALNHHVEALVSADRAFQMVAQLPWIDPATASIDRIFDRQQN
jgi:predicted nucleic acid-binding protein